MKRRLKLLGLVLLAALSLMAVSAGAAQAESTSVLIEGKTFPELGITEESIKGGLGEGSLLTAVLLLMMKCSGGTFKGKIKGDGTGNVELLISNCFLAGFPHCIVLESLTVKDHAILVGGTFKVILDGGKYYLLIEGIGASKSLVTFVIEDDGTEACLFDKGGEGTHYSGQGSIVVALTGNPEAGETKHTLETLSPETAKTLFPNDKLLLGLEELHFSAGIFGLAELAGKFAGKKWSLMMS